MKKILYKYMLLTLPLMWVSCEDLNTFPEDNIVTEDQKKKVVELDPSKSTVAVNAIFSQLSQERPNYTALGGWSRHNDIGYPSIMLFTDANGYDVVMDKNGYNWMNQSMDYSNRSITAADCQIVWNNLYANILSSNKLIESIDASTEDAAFQFNLAQGLSMRAFNYFLLAQLYQFNYVGHQSSPCVPLVTDKNMAQAAVDGGLPRSTVEQVYAQVNTDVDLAIELLEKAADKGVSRTDKRYVDLSVAYGLKARVKLTMQEWTEAATAASKAIETSSASPTGQEEAAKPAFWTITEKNWMWGIIVAETDKVVSSGIINWISHVGSLNYGYANFSGGMQINKALFNSISDSDARKGWWLNADSISANLTKAQQDTMKSYNYKGYTQVKFAPYNNGLKTGINANDIPLMRIEEMYLIKAEAEAMSGAGGAASLEDFVKTYRDDQYTCTASSPADVQEEVFRQRRIELWGEGLIWYDIMRLNKPVDRRGAGYPNATMVFNIPAGSPLLLWAIPEKEIEANQSLEKGDNNPSAPAPEPVKDFK